MGKDREMSGTERHASCCLGFRGENLFLDLIPYFLNQIPQGDSPYNGNDYLQDYELL